MSVSLADKITLACLLEATARKPGNVHPTASFDDLCYADFVASARTVGPLLAEALSRGVGRVVLESVRRTREVVAGNTNLGTVLLVAPLAAVPPHVSLPDGHATVLGRLDQIDADLVYHAIRLAQPGGMGKAATEDVAGSPTVTLLQAMQLAADRDTVAAEYAHGFPIVLRIGLPYLAAVKQFESCWEEAVVGLHLNLMSGCPDTLIARKCGRETALKSATMAQAVLDAGWPHSDRGQRRLAELDAWLRADGHRRNPGTTADLVAASLFAALREGAIPSLDPECFIPGAERL